MIKYLLALVFLTAAFSSESQNVQPVKPCSVPESSQFDFWIGNWDLMWNDTSHGTNNIVKIMDGCAVNENFLDPAINYRGSSWSMYNPQAKEWQQTWIDNQGGYIDLAGTFENNAMTLFTETTTDAAGKKIRYRMLYYNITQDKFDWSWDSTYDDGKTWKPNWAIHYQRTK